MIIFNVGARFGEDCVPYLARGDTVYAFEPTPQLLEEHLYPMQEKYSNFHVIPAAVSDFDGTATFNIAGGSRKGWGVSSLNEFSDDVSETWPNRTEMEFTEQVEVPVMRIDTFMEKEGIDKVGYLLCDAQGHDFQVLKGFGNRINHLKEGTVEVWRQNPLYKDSTNSEVNVKAFLLTRGFSIRGIMRNDVFGNEFNLDFFR